MLLVSFAWAIKSAFHLPNAMLCLCHFLAKKPSVAPHYPHNSSSWHRRPSMMLTQSPFPVFGWVPSRLDYSVFPEHAPDSRPHVFARVFPFPCRAQSIRLGWVPTSLLKSISHALDLVKAFLSRRGKNKAPGLMRLAFWLRMGERTISKKIKWENT